MHTAHFVTPAAPRVSAGVAAHAWHGMSKQISYQNQRRIQRRDMRLAARDLLSAPSDNLLCDLVIGSCEAERELRAPHRQP